MLVVIALCFLIALFAALLFATSLFLNIQATALKESLAIQESGEYIRRITETERSIKNANTALVSLAKARTETVSAGAIIESVAALVPTGVHLENVSVDAQSDVVSIRGFAQLRDQMLAFAGALSASEYAAPESLKNPDQNLLKEKNFVFELIFTIAGFERQPTKP